MTDRQGLHATLRRIPQVDRLVVSDAFTEVLQRHSRQSVLRSLRQHLDELRQQVQVAPLNPRAFEPSRLAAVIAVRLDGRRPYYRRVINASGVILHTGLGRAPLPAAAVAALAQTAGHPQRVEIRLHSGQRGGRDRGCEQLLCQLLGCPAATVVNNNAAATLLILAALARGREVVLSRGEMVEIGGSYRIPDILEESGCQLVGVGTTNRTHAADYDRAINPATGLLLKVHTSNYRLVGYTGEVDLATLVEIGRGRGVPVVHDLGSGSLLDLARHGRSGEQRVQESIAAGADLVCFSGDKLLGGPQAGILAGSVEGIELCRRHPLFRALRPGRLTYTALEATLRLYLDEPTQVVDQIPALSRLLMDESQLEQRARRLAASLADLPGFDLQAAPSQAQAGSGSLPARDYSSWALRLVPRGGSVDQLAAQLRRGDPPILGRLHAAALWLDLRTVGEADLKPLEDRLRELGGGEKRDAEPC